MNMEMDYFRNIINELHSLGLKNASIAKDLGITRQRLHHMLGKGKGSIPIQRVSDEILSKLRLVCKKHGIQPQTWSQLGRMIDKEMEETKNLPSKINEY